MNSWHDLASFWSAECQRGHSSHWSQGSQVCGKIAVSQLLGRKKQKQPLLLTAAWETILFKNLSSRKSTLTADGSSIQFVRQRLGSLCWHSEEPERKSQELGWGGGLRTASSGKTIYLNACQRNTCIVFEEWSCWECYRCVRILVLKGKAILFTVPLDLVFESGWQSPGKINGIKSFFFFFQLWNLKAWDKISTGIFLFSGVPSSSLKQCVKGRSKREDWSSVALEHCCVF